jgi:hypothetical protein
MTRRRLLDDEGPIHLVDHDSSPEDQSAQVMATRDHALIRTWAARRGAEPATGETTASGHGTIDVQDGGAGIRFNFPAVGRFRSITWDEWFQNFTQYDLMFVYEHDVPGQTPSTRYRLVPRKKLESEQHLQ